MELKKTISSISLLVDYWKKQDIEIVPNSIEKINHIVENKIPSLPNDFKEFYARVNGMEKHYPNYMDKEGFLFYPIESIISLKEEFSNSVLSNKDNIFLFAEFMHESWWFGIELRDVENYTIGIIPHENFFKPITNSLAEFIELYIDNSEKLYDYS